MKKTIYLVCISLITAVAVVYGIIHFFPKNLFKIGNWMGIKSVSEEDCKVETTADIVDEFDEIQLSIAIAEITIEPGDAYKVTSHSSKFLEPKVQLKNGILSVEQTTRGYNVPNNATCEITITVPADTKLTKIGGNIDVGDITIKDMDTELTDLKVNVGSLDCRNSSMGKTTIEVDTGDLSMDGCSFTYAEMTVDIGSVDLLTDEDLSNFNTSLTADIGEVNVNGKNYHESYSRDGEKKHLLTISVDIGDITVKY